jgi:glycosyltransferase involved in cell wall biosynthesis
LFLKLFSRDFRRGLYLTVPLVVSWSLVNALACERVVLSSDTAPVCEFIRDGENGLLGDFFDVDGLAGRAVDVLQNLAAYRGLGIQGRQLIKRYCSLDKTFPEMWNFFKGVMHR